MSAAIYSIIAENHYQTNELLGLLKEEGYLPSEETIAFLFENGNASRYGLARDGYWYVAEQNDEVREAVETNGRTFYAEQWFRNRH